jgi:hypothetical protein
MKKSQLNFGCPLRTILVASSPHPSCSPTIEQQNWKKRISWKIIDWICVTTTNRCCHSHSTLGSYSHDWKKNCHGKMLTQFWSPILVILITTSQNWKDYFIYIFVIYSIDNSHICTNLNAPKI